MPAPNSACAVLVSAFSQPSSKCEEGLRDLEKRGFTVRRGKGYSAIDQGRNQMTSEALHDGFAETMWIDSDVGFQADAVQRLRSHDLPITCGLYPQPGSRTIACHLLPGTEKIVFGDQGGLLEIKYAAAGFLHVRREAYELIRERLALPLCNTRFGRGNWPFFMPGAFEDQSAGETGHRYLTEEYAFSHRARQAGLKIMADTTIRLWRTGSYGFSWEDAGGDSQRFGTYRFQVES
jgi:hypothetical protein